MNRIGDVRFGGYPEWPYVASYDIVGLSSDESSDSVDQGITEAQTIQMGTFISNSVWNNLSDHVSAAKQRLAKRPIEEFPMLVDFGPLSFAETQTAWDLDHAGLGAKEKLLRNALGLHANEPNLWSEYSLLLVRPV